MGNRKPLFPTGQSRIWTRVMGDLEHLREIRIRAGKPVLVYRKEKELSVDKDGNYLYEIENGRIFSYEEIQALLNYWCEDSRYAFQEEIRRGFLTIPGGHRIGLSGEGVVDGKESLQTIKYISSLNIRIAHEVKNVAGGVLEELYEHGRVKNLLIMSPPGAGKTTLLRDLVRQISDGNRYAPGQSVGIVDERSEIAACYQGIPQLDVGKRSDVLDGCPKAVGMMLLLRSMAPNVIAVDELGSREDIAAVHRVVGSGCSILATIHGNSLEEMKEKPVLQPLFHENIFDEVMVLSRRENIFCKKTYSLGEKEPCSVY